MTSTLTLAQRARNEAHARQRYQIRLIHPFDPRGQKVGGLETYIRDFITFHPADTDLLFIGVDSVGDLALGEIHKLTFRERTFDFLPILHYTDQQAREAARTIRSSLTGQFFVALLRHFGIISKEIRERRCSIDLRRVEFSWLPVVLRLPFIQMLHGEGAPKLQMDPFCANTPSSTTLANASLWLQAPSSSVLIPSSRNDSRRRIRARRKRSILCGRGSIRTSSSRSRFLSIWRRSGLCSQAGWMSSKIRR